jgi:hypothetical protein
MKIHIKTSIIKEMVYKVFYLNSDTKVFIDRGGINIFKHGKDSLRLYFN